jgi:hypothetical protein
MGGNTGRAHFGAGNSFWVLLPIYACQAPIRVAPQNGELLSQVMTIARFETDRTPVLFHIVSRELAGDFVGLLSYLAEHIANDLGQKP